VISGSEGSRAEKLEYPPSLQSGVVRVDGQGKRRYIGEGTGHVQRRDKLIRTRDSTDGD
jgi:hypothetical protein